MTYKLIALAALVLPSLVFGQNYDRSRLEENPDLGFSSTAARFFLDNLKPPVIRVVPRGVTWIEYPRKIGICEVLSDYMTASPLKPEQDGGADNLSILSLKSYPEKMSEETRDKLKSGLPVPPDNINCLIGNNKKVIIFVTPSADATFIVDLVVREKVTIKDLVPSHRTKPRSSVSRITAATPIRYDLEFYRDIKDHQPSEIFKFLKKGGKI